MRARRATIYVDSAGEWRYKIQGANWKIIDASEEGFLQFRTASLRVQERWPDVEEIILIHTPELDLQ